MNIRNYWKELGYKPECPNGNHYFTRYNDTNLICKKCGRLAKIGYMQQKPKQDE